MSISCDQWPMNLLTRAVGEKDRTLIVHPKAAVERRGIRRDSNGELDIVDPTAIKFKKAGFIYPEVKEAGHRHLFFRNSRGSYGCFGRRLNVNNIYTDIYDKIKRMHLPTIPKKTVIDFELCWPNHPDSEVITAIKECPEELVMRAFAVPIYKGHLLIGDNSDTYLSGRNRLFKCVGKENVVRRYKCIDPSLHGNDMKGILTKLMRWAEKYGQEGWVLKEAACDSWWKLKGVNEADVFVIGFKISNAKTRKGMVTAVKVAVYEDKKSVYVGNVSGFSLEEMDAMTKAYNDHGDSEASNNPYLYKTLRIIYQEMAGKGGLKHAFRDCWRDDKNYSECRMEQFI